MNASAADADWVHDAEWSLPSSPSDSPTADGDWLLCPNPAPRLHLLGFFLTNNTRHTYLPLLPSSSSLAADLISSLPTSASICAGARSAVLARAPWSSYYIRTPNSPTWTRIPNPIHSHPTSVPIALADGFRVICAVPLPDGHGYRFEIYESSAAKWRIGPDHLPVGEIIPASGVCCGGAAYFRTETPSVVAYDDETGEARILAPPPGRWGEEEVRWELAEGDGRLRCVCVRGRGVEVYELGERDVWMLMEEAEAIVCGEAAWPVRVQSEGRLAVMWVDGRVGRWDLERGGGVGLWVGEEAPAPGKGVEYVPFCGELHR